MEEHYYMVILSEIGIFEGYTSKGLDLQYFSLFVPFKWLSHLYIYIKISWGGGGGGIVVGWSSNFMNKHPLASLLYICFFFSIFSFSDGLGVFFITHG